MSYRLQQSLSERRCVTRNLPSKPAATTPPFSFSTTDYRYAETDCVSASRRRRVTAHLEGVRYYGYRYYNPELGRWISRDPIGERGGDNIYMFVNNNPVIHVDKHGLELLRHGKWKVETQDCSLFRIWEYLTGRRKSPSGRSHGYTLSWKAFRDRVKYQMKRDNLNHIEVGMIIDFRAIPTVVKDIGLDLQFDNTPVPGGNCEVKDTTGGGSICVASAPSTKEFEMSMSAGGAVGYIIIGGGSYHIVIENVDTGASSIYTMAAFGVGVGLPSFRATAKSVRFVTKSSKTTESFEGYGYIGGASAEIIGGIKIGGGVKIPNGPFIPGDLLGLDAGGFDISVSHNITHWYLRN